MEEMIELHSKYHGAQYWRTLLKRTAAEIIAEPNYTAVDLSAREPPNVGDRG